MTTDIKEYKEMFFVETKDGKIYELPVEQQPQFEEAMKTQDIIWFGKYDSEHKRNIERTYYKKIDEIDWFIANQPRSIKDVLYARERWKKENLGRGWDSLQEVMNYIEKKGLK